MRERRGRLAADNRRGFVDERVVREGRDHEQGSGVGYAMSFIRKHAHAIVFSAALSQAVALSQSPLPQTESSLSRNPALVRDWANRLLANDPKVRATAEAALVQGAPRSLPLLRRFLDPGHEDLHVVTFEIIQRIGPPAIPLLVDLLRHESDSIRRNAVDELIDLAPHTEWIQPALRRALRDEDSMVAGDAARALGALGKRASPSVRRSRQYSFARGSVRPHLRGGGFGVHRSERGQSDKRLGRSPGRSHSRRSMGGV